jgi:hypothetical protein
MLLGGCFPTEGLDDTCTTAQAGLHNAQLIASGIHFTDEHQTWADAAVFTASALVNAVCPPNTPPLEVAPETPVIPETPVLP